MNARFHRLLLRTRRSAAAPRPRLAPARVPSRRRAAAAVLTGLAAFVAAQCALAGSSYFTHWVADPAFSDKEQELTRVERAAPPGAARVVLLGSSRTGLGFAAGEVEGLAAADGVPAVAFNFGTPGAGPITHLMHLNRLLAAGHRPDLLIIEILPPLLTDTPGGPAEGRIMGGDLLTREEIALGARYGIPTERWRRQWREAALLPAYTQRFKLLGRAYPEALPFGLRYDWGRPPCPNGWGPTTADEVTDEVRARATAHAHKEYHGTLGFPLPAGPAVAAMRDLLALCRAERIPTGLVLLPEGTTFRAMYRPGTEERIATFLTELTAEFGFPVTDARPWMADDRFFDGHHLMRPGGLEFTARFTREALVPRLRALREGRE